MSKFTKTFRIFLRLKWEELTCDTAKQVYAICAVIVLLFSTLIISAIHFTPLQCLLGYMSLIGLVSLFFWLRSNWRKAKRLAERE